MKPVMAIAAGSMDHDLARLQSIAHNLANVSTTGFKREIVVGDSFPMIMDGVAHSTSLRAASTQRLLDMTQGPLRVTSNPLDLAIEGEGFLELLTPSGPRYIRSAAFKLDATGKLVHQDGHAVQGSSGTILLNGPEPTIDKRGNIFEKGEMVASLRVVSFVDNSRLVYEGGGLFRSTTEPVLRDSAETRVRQGHLEASNVNAPQEMVRLIEVTRHFESLQKMMQGLDEMGGKAAEKLGQF
jgi:flagellar basal-body rod protein FlgF